MRVVFDTNVLVSALLSEKSTSAQAVFAMLQKGEVLLSDSLANEINHVLQRKKFASYISAEQREDFLAALVYSATLVHVMETIVVCRDPKDNHILELAVSGKADVIVTGDHDLLVLHPFQGIAVLNPRVFCEQYYLK